METIKEFSQNEIDLQTAVDILQEVYNKLKDFKYNTEGVENYKYNRFIYSLRRDYRLSEEEVAPIFEEVLFLMQSINIEGGI